MKRSKLDKRQNGRWQPLEQVPVLPPTPERIEALMAFAKRVFPDLSDADVLKRMNPDERWENDRYQVAVRRNAIDNPMGIPMVHLSIKTHDRAPVRDWRDFQRIKNQLVGEECEAVELYPAESRIVDTANQYHLWAFPEPGMQFPVGFFSGRRVTSEAGANSVQRPLDDDNA